MTRYALYLRQSKDTEGDELAINRQRQNCLELVAREGGEVDPARVYVDNDVSASSAKVRPAYARMVEDVRAGRIDVVVAWNLDRLTRKPREIEDWLDMHELHGVNLLTSERKERIDLSTDNGRMMLRITAAVARGEVERKGRRQKESNAQSRDLGIPAGGRRAFGYSPVASGAKAITATRLGADGREYPAYGHEPIEPEATAVRQGFDLLLAGGTLAGIAKAWNRAGLTTTDGGEWSPYAVRGVLSNPRYAAQIGAPRIQGVQSARHNLDLRDDVRPGTWEPLVPLETWLAACEILRDPARRSNPGAPRRWLLSGIATCGVCGAPMKAGATKNAVHVYRCSESAHLARKADDADLYVIGRVVERFTDPASAARLRAAMDAKAPADVATLKAQLLAAQRGEATLAMMLAKGDLSPAAARPAIREAKAAVATLTAQVEDAGRGDVLGPLLEAGDVAAAWDARGIDLQRAVVRALWPSVVMVSPGKGSRPPRDEAGRMAHAARTVLLEAE